MNVLIDIADILNINNQIIHFEDIFDKKIDVSLQKNNYLNNKTILITGGAGSIGSSLIKHLLNQNIKEIIALDHSEYGIFQLGLFFKTAIENKKLFLILGDIRNQDTINHIFSTFPIQIIYHAAAYKHIAILENNSTELISVNTEATLNILFTAKKQNAEQFIFISTDKAVNPINKMGISKRITELYLIKEFLTKKDNFIVKILRFGNVFNSNGSIFNIFKFQIENKLPITITHKSMKRYFISKFQATQGLIILSNPLFSSGIYILNMGQPYIIEEILFKILQKLNLDYIPNISYTKSKSKKYEKFDEELIFSYETQEKICSECNKINLNSYNLKKIETEIKKYSQLLKI